MDNLIFSANPDLYFSKMQWKKEEVEFYPGERGISDLQFIFALRETSMQMFE